MTNKARPTRKTTTTKTPAKTAAKRATVKRTAKAAAPKPAPAAPVPSLATTGDTLPEKNSRHAVLMALAGRAKEVVAASHADLTPALLAAKAATGGKTFIAFGADGVPMAQATFETTTEKYVADDPAAFAAWVARRYPDKVTMTPVVDAEFAAELLSKERLTVTDGIVVDNETGAPVDGVVFKPKETTDAWRMTFARDGGKQAAIRLLRELPVDAVVAELLAGGDRS